MYLVFKERWLLGVCGSNKYKFEPQLFYLKNNPQSVSEYATPQTCAYLPFHAHHLETHHPPPHQLPLSKHWDGYQM